MATATASRPFACGIISLTIAINDHRYSVDAIDPGESGTRAFRLTKHGRDRAVYDVLRDTYGIVACTCPDYEFRHNGTDAAPCKHGLALVALGLMPAPVAAPAPADAPCCAPAEPVPSDRIDPDDAEGDTAPWEDGWDDHVWGLGPTAEDLADFAAWKREAAAREHLCPEGATLTLAELVDRQAESYRGWPVEAGAMIARAIEELALKVRMVDAVTPADYEARVELLDADVRRQWEAIGYEDGKAACPCPEPVVGGYGHMA